MIIIYFVMHRIIQTTNRKSQMFIGTSDEPHK